MSVFYNLKTQAKVKLTDRSLSNGRVCGPRVCAVDGSHGNGHEGETENFGKLHFI